MALKPFVKSVAQFIVPPVNVLEGKFWYVVAEIVLALNPAVN